VIVVRVRALMIQEPTAGLAPYRDQAGRPDLRGGRSRSDPPVKRSVTLLRRGVT